MTTVRRALLFSFVERYLLIVLGLLSNILLARLLTPTEIGLYSVSLAVIGIAQVLRDFGVGNFLIQVKDLKNSYIQTAFGFSLAIGFSLFLVVFFGAELAGKFYEEPQIVQTMRISSLNFLVIPFCTISLSLLRRDMAFRQLMIVNLISSIVSFIVTLGMAYSGFGANSMALGAVVGNIAAGFSAWLARADRVILFPKFTEWRTLLNFGSRSSAANILTTISMDVNELAIGKILGFAPVAMISRGQGLMNIFHRDIMSAVRNVALPAFSVTHRKQGDLEQQHNFSVAAITVVGWPFYAFASVFSAELLRFLFGPQWNEASALVPWFCLAGAAAALCNLVISLLTAQGRIDLATKIDLVIQPIRAVLLVVGTAYYQSILAFAIFYCISGIFSLPYIYYIKEKSQKTNFKVFFKYTWKSFQVTFWTSIPCVLFKLFAPRENGMTNIYYVIAAACLCFIFWILSIQKTKHPISEEEIFKKAIGKIKFLRT